MTLPNDAPQNRNSKTNNALVFYSALISSVTSIGLLAAVSLWIYYKVDISFFNDASCHHAGNSVLLQKFSLCFYSDKWNDETYLASISSIYTTIITVLIALQALISWLSFMVIRNSNKQEIEREIEKEIPYFFKTKEADKILQDALQEISRSAARTAAIEVRDDEDKALETLQKLIYDELQPQFEGFRGKIEEMEVKLRKLENGDSDDDVEDVDDQMQEAEVAEEPQAEGKLTE